VSETVAELAPAILPPPAPRVRPEPIFNCPQCQHWLAEGTLECPDCDSLIYAVHLRTLALAAAAEEHEQHWTEASEIWNEALEWLPVETKQAEAIRQRIGLLNAKLQNVADFKTKWAKRLGPLAPAFFFLLKAKSFFFLLLKAKFLLSFIGFFALYWALWGWKFGLGFTLSILLHEMGHYVAARRRGLRVDLPVFLPGLGAYVRWYSQGVSLETLSTIALAGPFFGLLTAAACGLIAMRTGSPLFSGLANVGAWINLVNLIPIFGLDGAQATYALDRTQRWLVFATALIFFGVLHEGPFAFIAIGMGWRLWQGGYAEKPSSRILTYYVLLLFALGLLIARFPEMQSVGRF
jgi:Zn-dependent protease